MVFNITFFFFFNKIRYSLNKKVLKSRISFSNVGLYNWQFTINVNNKLNAILTSRIFSLRINSTVSRLNQEETKDLMKLFRPQQEHLKQTSWG